MSSPSLNPRHPQDSDWAARLIPGADPAHKKRPQRETSVRPVFWPSTPDRVSVRPIEQPPDVTNVRDKNRTRLFLENIRSLLRFAIGKFQGLKWPDNPISSKSGPRNVLIIGADILGQAVATSLVSDPQMKRKFCGFLDDRKPRASDIIGRTTDLAMLARTEFIDEVIVVAPHDRELTLRILEAGRRLRLDVKMVPDLFGCEPPRELERIGTFPIISLHEEPSPVLGLMAKRALDILGAAAALTLLWPVLLLLGLLVKLDCPGPVLYAAPRAGCKAKPFLCYKFRTMVLNAEALKIGLRLKNQRVGPFFKMTCDPRVTRVGRILRRYSLDELPQLWNVLKGEMSLVGPRPHPIDDFSSYAVEHLSRLDMTPGITGLWQVTARRDPSFHKSMELDTEYIRRWSLLMDFKILLKTAGAVLRGNGD